MLTWADLDSIIISCHYALYGEMELECVLLLLLIPDVVAKSSSLHALILRTHLLAAALWRDR